MSLLNRQSPSQIRLHRNIGDIIALCGILLICGWMVFNYFGRYAFDDSYVGYAYARNVSLGYGYIFDHGPGTLLSTSAPLAVPLYALLANLFATDIVNVAQGVSTFALLLLAVCSYFVFRNYVAVLGAFAATAVLILSPYVQVDWSHETLLAIAVLAAGSLLLVRERFFSAAIIIGIASLCRGEALVAVAALATYPSTLLDLRKRGLLCATALLPYVAWSAFAIMRFGTPFSSTIASKSAQGRYEDITLYLYGCVDYTNQMFHAFGFKHLLMAAVAALTVTVVAVLVARKVRFGELLVAVLCLLISALYVVLGLPFYFWFTTQIAIFISICIAAPWLEQTSAQQNRPVVKIARAAAMLAACIIIVTGLRIAGSDQKYRMPQLIVMPDIQHNAYQRLGEWLRIHSQPSDLVSTFEFGKIHYYSGRNLIDPLGILAPGLSSQMRAGNAIWELEKYHPTILAEVDDFHYFVDPIEYEWFSKAYRLSNKLDFETYPAEASRTHFRIYRLENAKAIPRALTLTHVTVLGINKTPGLVDVKLSPISLRRVEVRVKALVPCRVRLSALLENGLHKKLGRDVQLAVSVTRISLELPADARVAEIEVAGGNVNLAPTEALRKHFVLWKSPHSVLQDINALTFY